MREQTVVGVAPAFFVAVYTTKAMIIEEGKEWNNLTENASD